MVTSDNISDDAVVEVVEEVVVPDPPSRSRSNEPKSEYDAEWPIPDDYPGGPPPMLDLVIVGYNKDGEAVGPFRVLAPSRVIACSLVGIDIGVGPASIIN
tara:strand:+ start:547 stop:846 length:300 start_codon:yes stop_codon:yes gene_type:complete